MKTNLNNLHPRGGGDGPEAVATAMGEVLKLDWRPPPTTRFCLWIADAPPHGLGGGASYRDGFPNGDPAVPGAVAGVDPVQIAQEMLKKGIILYPFSVDSFKSYPRCFDFYGGLAQVTGGQFLPLESSDLLCEVVTAAAREEISIEAQLGRVMAEVRKLEAGGMITGQEAVAREVHRRLARVRTKRVRVEAETQMETSKFAEAMIFAQTLDEWKAFFDKPDTIPALAKEDEEEAKVSGLVRSLSRTPSASGGAVVLEEAAISRKQVERLVRRGKARAEEEEEEEEEAPRVG